MSFTNPVALLLLLVLFPIVIYVGWPRSRFRRRRDVTSIVIRLILILLIVLGLAGLEVPQEAEQLAVVFLVDVSDSMDRNASDAALEYVESAIAEMDTDRDQAAVILFGENAVVEQPMDSQIDLSQLGADPITLNTDLAEAIRLGLAILPPDSARRLVVLSDGIETVGDSESAAQLAAATNVQIDYVPYQRTILPEEVLVSDVSIPPRINEGEIFNMTVNVDSEEDTSANIRVAANGRNIYDEPHTLNAGSNRISIQLPAIEEPGFVNFRVEVVPLDQDVDAFQNNTLSAFTEVRGNPAILLVARDDEEIRFLQPALESNGFVTEVVEPSRIPADLAELSGYSSIVLVDAPATEMTDVQMDLLQIYVRDLGGGLVAIGGPNSYGVGGYFETALEETLPVEMRIRDEERIPSLTMLFVLDRSGSMSAVSGPSGFSNLELAKEAILRSFNFLNDYDRTGVISFEEMAYSVIDIQAIGGSDSRQRLENEVMALGPGGGTDIRGALNNAAEVLPNDASALKHIILLTDGIDSENGSTALADSLYLTHDITLSVVSTGSQAMPWLQNLAAAGRGNFYATSDPSTIPTIFAQETVLATRSYIFEEEFFPTLTSRSPIVDGLSSAPSLQGYIATTEKDTATVIFRSPEEDPVLASWQYGLGRSVAFTSDASARWGANWVTWENYTTFWSQAVNWTITEGASDNLEVRVEERGDETFLVVDARDDDGDFLNGLTLNTSVVDPNLETEFINIPQVAPGRYELVLSPENQGAYFFGLTGGVDDTSVGQNYGWVLSYSNEYGLTELDVQRLEDVARVTGGGSLEANPAGAFERNLDLQNVSAPVWPWLFAIAAFLLIFDIAVRRLVINRSELVRMREAATRAVGVGARERRRTATTGRMGGLMDAKTRATRGDEAPMAPVNLGNAPAASEDKPRRTRGRRGKQQPGGSSSVLASKLLETKKRNEDQ